MLENKDKLSLASLGEFGLIDRIASSVEIKNESTIKGIGDDGAVIDMGDKAMVVSTDMLVEGIHFDLVYTPLKHLGYKAVAVNLSDIFAMNAMPAQITVSIAVSSKITLDAIEEFYAGVNLACDRYGVDLVGGDTSSSVTGFTISVTAMGTAAREDVVYRSGAAENDLICISGDLGASYLGLQILEREKRVHLENKAIQPDLEGYDYILEKMLKPEPRAEIIEQFKELGLKPTSMIDVSDGLSSDLMHICVQSNAGCRIYENKIPIDPVTINAAEGFNLDPMICALNGGEDYELLFTVSQSDYDKVNEIPGITVIGHITDKGEGINLVTQAGEFIELKAMGWTAFREG
jgi:thiamine-monophosphate kinase